MRSLILIPECDPSIRIYICSISGMLPDSHSVIMLEAPVLVLVDAKEDPNVLVIEEGLAFELSFDCVNSYKLGSKCGST